MKTQQLVTRLDAPADRVFAAITDLDRLSEWNGAIIGVVERPDRLDPGAEWAVTMHALGQTWASRSTLLEYAPGERRFQYRSRTDDGNPSWAEWTWTVAPVDSARCDVTVSWTLSPKTFWRRVLFAHIRARQLRRTELPRSLARLQQTTVVPAA